MQIEYFAMDGCPGQFFRCDKLSATLKTETCALKWRESQRSQGHHGGEQRSHGCMRCHIGAMHAGETQASTSAIMGRPLCSRCHRSATRLVAKAICVSCYNRQREWVIGRNAKGTKPVKQKPLYHIRLPHLSGDKLTVARAEYVESTAEMIIRILKSSRQQVTFGFAARAMA